MPHAWYRQIWARAGGGATMALDWKIKNGQSQQGRYSTAYSTPDHSFMGLFCTLQHCNINTSSKTTANYCLHRKTHWMKALWWFALTTWDFATYGTAHAELLWVCCWCVSPYVGSMYLSLCLSCRLVPMLATLSWIAASVRWALRLLFLPRIVSYCVAFLASYCFILHAFNTAFFFFFPLHGNPTLTEASWRPNFISDHVFGPFFCV